jgi:hypothetical protein
MRQVFLALLAFPLFVALFIVDLWPGRTWEPGGDVTRNMGTIRRAMHGQIVKLLDHLECLAKGR